MYRDDVQSSEYVSPRFDYNTEIIKPTLLLHSCCGPCCASVIEGLAAVYAVTVFFYNPNITDAGEYEKRLESQKKFIDEYNNRPDRQDVIGFIEGDYEPECFFDEVKGLENEPEGGARCVKCFRMRLEKTAQNALLLGFDCFSTTLSVSPHKSYNAISEIGRDICVRYGAGFLDRDFKKGGAYERGVELAKKYALYRQDYCGCRFSRGW